MINFEQGALHQQYRVGDRGGLSKPQQAASRSDGSLVLEQKAGCSLRRPYLLSSCRPRQWAKPGATLKAKQAPPTSAGNTKPCDTSSPIRLVCTFRSPCLRRLFALSAPFVRLSFAFRSPCIRLAFHMLFHRSNRIPDLVPVGVCDSEPSHVGGMQGECKANARRMQGECKANARRNPGERKEIRGRFPGTETRRSQVEDKKKTRRVGHYREQGQEQAATRSVGVTRSQNTMGQTLT